MTKSQQLAAFTGFRSAKKGERGFTLLEILVALGILSAVAVVFLLGMTTSSKAVMISQENVTAESLAKSQMEYIKGQAYDDDLNHDPPQYLTLDDEDIPAGYDTTISALRLDPDSDGFADDDGLQQITVTVTRNGEPTYTLIGYKMKP